MHKQLIITGFHCSGTSMLAQEINNAGLFIGERLMSPAISNADGHYEDMDFFTFHEKVLRSHHASWQYTSDKPLDIPEQYELDMHRIIQSRNNQHKQWGFKDPRSALFLDQWYTHLKNPYTVVIYRHFEECVNSLMHRAAGEILYNQSSNICFWEDPTLAYRMWLSYNKKIIEHVKKHPKTTIVLSHRAVLGGFPVVNSIKEKFQFDLDSTVNSAIKKDLITSHKYQHFSIDEQLKQELNETWEMLESLSISPAGKLADSKVVGEVATKNKFQETLVALKIPSQKDETIDTTIQKLREETLRIEEKIELIKKTRPVFRKLLKMDVLIVVLKELIEQDFQNANLYLILIDIYNAEKRYDDSEALLLKLFSIVDAIYPFHFNMLANILLKKGEIEKSKFYIGKAIKLNPKNPAFYMTLSNISYEKCLYDDALGALNNALNLDIDNPNMVINFNLRKIDILSELGRIDEAKSILASLEEDFPSDERILKKVKSFDAVEGMNEVNKSDYYKSVLSDLQKDPYFYSRVLVLIEKIDSEWAKNDFIVRLLNHFQKLMYKKSSIETASQSYKISFVVDRLALHYYQAELLLYSLIHCANIPKENILVQCLNRVDKEFFDFLESEDYNYCIVEPYLDGKYCNKLQQLEAFKLEDLVGIDGVILLDTDVFALKPFDIPDPHTFSAKTVDAPNPPLEVLNNIFKEAEIERPKIIPSDWKMVENDTFACNFNGGFYYIPSAIVSELSSEWRKWASWLYDRSELFANKQQAIHTDQVSMAMAITSLQVPYYNLSANSNTPIHNNKVLTSLNDKMEIALLHYHREITSFGLLNNKNVSHQKIIDAIDKANTVIAQKEKHYFFLAYKKNLVSKNYIQYSFKDVNQVLKEMTESYSEKLTLIIHVGTPKTATTSLQFFLDDHHDILLQKGILYPKVYIDTPAPKHQWMVSALMTEDYKMFLDKLKKGLEEARSDTHTVILSTEGIYNHWHDYSLQSKAFLVLLSNYFNMHIWVWFRNPASFAKSLYHQYMKNQRLPSVKCYGHNMTFDEMLKDEWFIKHLDYTGFLLECSEMFGEENISSFILDGDIIKMVSHKLGLHIDSKAVERKNISLTCASVEILKIINNYPLPGAQKNKAVESLYEIDTLLKSYTQEDKSCNTSSESIHRLFALQHPILKEKYCLDFKE